MNLYLRSIIPAFVTIAAAALILTAVKPVAGQAPAAAENRVPTPGQFPPYRAPRTADGKPDLNGIWQAGRLEANLGVQFS